MENLFSKICETFRIKTLRDYQRDALKAIQMKKDVFISQKTGLGKSLVYQSLSEVGKFNGFQNPIVIVVEPLILIMKEQSSYLNTLGYNATYIGKDEKENADIVCGKFDFLFGNPESLLGETKWRDMLRSSIYQENVYAIVVDEAHTVNLWGGSKQKDGFRHWFSKIGEIRSLLPGRPMTAMTATASLIKRRQILKSLAMKNPVKIIASPQRENITLNCVKKSTSCDKQKTFQWLTRELKLQGETYPRTVVFCKSIKDCAELYITLRDVIPTEYFNMYHSMTPDNVKSKIMAEMGDSQSTLRVLICTNAAGMGVNFSAISSVIHYGPPQEMDTFLQQLGRAGREGLQASHVLIYNVKQLRNVDPDMLAYVRSDKCLQEEICDIYGVNFKARTEHQHLCCLKCLESCVCGEITCKRKHPACSETVSSAETCVVSDTPISRSEQDGLRQALLQYRGQLQFQHDSLYPSDLSSVGFSIEAIDDIVSKANQLHSAEDILQTCCIWNLEQAMAIFDIITSVSLSDFLSMEIFEGEADYMDCDDH